MKKTNTLLLIFFLFVLVYIVYAPSLENSFVNWDDFAYVVDNPTIKSLTLKTVKTIFTSFSLSSYQPFVLLSFAADYYFFKLNPLGYHLINLVLHLCNVILVFFLILRLSHKAPVALLVACLFGIHPIHVESIAWISQRKDVLYAFFFLGSLISYLAFLGNGRWRWLYYVVSLVLFVFSFFSKGMALALPFVLILIDVLLGRTMNRRLWFEKLPFFLLLGILFLVTVTAHYHGGGLYTTNKDLAMWHSKVAIAMYAIMFYLGKLLIPFGLSAMYPSPEPAQIIIAIFLFVLLVVLTAFVMLVWKQQRRRLIFGVAFFAIMLLPALQLVQVGVSYVADRYVYVASIGIYFLFSLSLYWCYTKIKKKGIRKFLFASFALYVFLLCFISYQRIKVWQDSISLWTDVIQKYPNSLAFNNRCAAFSKIADYDAAIKDCTWSIRSHPRNHSAFINRGLAYQAKGNFKQALADYTQAIAINPDSAEGYYNQGVVLYMQEKFEDALKSFNNAVERNVNFAQAYNGRGAIFMRLGDFNEAIANYRQAIALEPGLELAYVNLGIALQKKGDIAEALLEYEKAILVSPNLVQAYYNRGLAYQASGNLLAALSNFSKAIEINHFSVNSYRARADIYLQLKELKKSWADVEKLQSFGARIDPAFLERLQNASGV
ncbi:MAG: tetratricopeptide repeat protein [Candidatus Omnitrophica bacterium]|nr:tetratricopeptide repeat protein [Candidatus Omnitrophota bacterium]